MLEWINHYRRWYTLLEVDPKRLLQTASNTKSYFEPNLRKLNTLIERFQGGEIDAPIVGRDWEGIAFVDGRHRTVLAAKLGLPTIKIAVLPEETEFIQDFLNGIIPVPSGK